MISFIMETVPADAAFLAIAGRYYVLDDALEPSLQDGATGPASFERAAGALLGSPSTCSALTRAWFRRRRRRRGATRAACDSTCRTTTTHRKSTV